MPSSVSSAEGFLSVSVVGSDPIGDRVIGTDPGVTGIVLQPQAWKSQRIPQPLYGQERCPANREAWEFGVRGQGQEGSEESISGPFGARPCFRQGVRHHLQHAAERPARALAGRALGADQQPRVLRAFPAALRTAKPEASHYITSAMRAFCT